MSNKKNIDGFFQEKFKDFEANPADEVWGVIEAKLDEKKRKRVIPFWWKLSGVAAVLLLGFILSNTFFNPNIVPTDTIVVDKDLNQSEKETNASSTPGKETISNASTTLDGFTNNDEINDDSSKLSPKRNNETPQTNSNKEQKGEKTNLSNSVNNAKSALVYDKSIKSQGSSSNHKSSKFENSFEEKTPSIAEKTNSSNLVQEENQMAQKKIDNNTIIAPNSTLDLKELNLDALKGNQNTTIAIKEEENKIVDTTTNKALANNPLEELLDQKEKKTKQESKLNKWQLTSNVTPVFLGSISNGSPIDSTLMKNSKSFNTGVGFGLGVSYNVNKKLTIRTGLNKFNMSYNTNDIVYYAGIESRALKNINPSAAGSMIQIETGQINPQSIAPSETDMLPFENSIMHKNKGYINQEMGYLEMPLELSYALIDKKIGINVIGGFSTLFLQDNAVNVISDNRSTYLGEANNLSAVHFSTNIGLGLKYGFMKSFEFNVEPTFKYQINTYRSNAGDFKPYLFGIYSGVSYKF